MQQPTVRKVREFFLNKYATVCGYIYKLWAA